MEEQKIEEKPVDVGITEKEFTVPAEEASEEKKPGNEDEEEEKKIDAEAADAAEGPPTSEPLTETTSFKEESYSVGDLTDSEKKALEAFRLKVEEAIKNKTIFKKPKKKAAEKVVLAEAAPAEAETPAPTEAKEADVEEGEAPIAVAEEPVSTPLAAEEVPPDADKPVAEEREILIEESLAPPVEAPKNFYLWGIPVHEGDDKTDAVLLKFLKARNFKVDDALGMLKNTVKWRKDYSVDGMEEEEIEGKEEFEKWAFLFGVDKEGHPVWYNRNAFQVKEVSDKAQFSKFLRWRVQTMEQSVKSRLDFAPGGVHSFIQVIDMQNFPGLLKGAQSIKKLVTLLQDNYPELAAKQIVLNMPWWFSPFLSGVYKLESKVVSAGPGKATETLFKYIAPDQVPIEYGGLGRSNDTDFDGVDAPVTQLILKAGEKQSIELPIEEVGSTLVWDISIVGGDVVYGEEYVPSSYTVVIRKPKKLPAITEPIRNSFKATELGKVVITVDNSVSKKKKTVVYRSTIKRTTVE